MRVTPARRAAWPIALLAALAGCSRPEPAPPRDPLNEALRAAGLSPAELEGARLFAERCAACHGDAGRGDGPNASFLDPQPPDLVETLPSRPLSRWRRVVEDGSVAVGRSPLCPPRGRSLSEWEGDALIAYLSALARSRKAPPG